MTKQFILGPIDGAQVDIPPHDLNKILLTQFARLDPGRRPPDRLTHALKMADYNDDLVEAIEAITPTELLFRIKDRRYGFWPSSEWFKEQYQRGAVIVHSEQKRDDWQRSLRNRLVLAESDDISYEQGNKVFWVMRTADVPPGLLKWTKDHV